MFDLAHEHREEGHGLADAGVIDAHEAAAAGGVVGVPAAVPESAVPPGVGGVLPLVLVAVLVVVIRLQLVGRRRGAVAAVERQGPRRVGPAEVAQAAGLVGQVELRPAEHLRRGGVRDDEQQEQGEQWRWGPLLDVHGVLWFFLRTEVQEKIDDRWLLDQGVIMILAAFQGRGVYVVVLKVV